MYRKIYKSHNRKGDENIEYLHYVTLTLREKVEYITNIITNWKYLGVNDDADIIRELSLNSNNDKEVLAITRLVLQQLSK